ncbi:MAG: transposase, partial [Egibacteraceae bacterium]
MKRRSLPRFPRDGRGPAVPGGGIHLSLPGLGDLPAARTAGETGDAVEVSDSPNALQCCAGKAPVTRRSGKTELTAATRLA